MVLQWYCLLLSLVFVHVCKYCSFCFHFMCKVFPVNSCRYLWYLQWKKMCLEQNSRFKVRLHAVMSSCIPNDRLQKPVFCLRFGDIFTNLLIDSQAIINEAYSKQALYQDDFSLLCLYLAGTFRGTGCLCFYLPF